MLIMTKEEADANGYPTYGLGVHKLIDTSDGNTLILLLPNKVYVTIAPLDICGGDWACLDIQVHGNVIQKILGFTKGIRSNSMSHKTYSLDINKIF